MSFFSWLIFWKRQQPEVLDGWFAPCHDFESSPQKFYESIEAELVAKRIPDLAVSRQLFAEGGLLSAQREYLRMRRERLVFDVCSAPFGTYWFFNYRLWAEPSEVRLWQVVCVLLVLGGIGYAYWAILGLYWGVSLFVLNIVSACVLMRNAVALGLQRLDDILLRLPVLGPVYEDWMRPDTYYRQDTRNMYLHAIRDIVESKVREFVGAPGVQLRSLRDVMPEELQKLAAAMRRAAP